MNLPVHAPNEKFWPGEQVGQSLEQRPGLKQWHGVAEPLHAHTVAQMHAELLQILR